MKALQLTFQNGDTAEFPFGPDSTLTIDTPDGANGVKRGSWSEITDVALVEAKDESHADVVLTEPDPVPADDTLASPEAALDHAASLPIAEAVAHVDAALAKWPDDPDLLATKAELAEIQAA